jgi:hypothetical protein
MDIVDKIDGYLNEGIKVPSGYKSVDVSVNNKSTSEFSRGNSIDKIYSIYNNNDVYLGKIGSFDNNGNEWWECLNHNGMIDIEYSSYNEAVRHLIKLGKSKGIDK